MYISSNNSKISNTEINAGRNVYAGKANIENSDLIATNDIVLQKGDIATILLKKSDFKKVKKFFNKTGLIGFI